MIASIYSQTCILKIGSDPERTCAKRTSLCSRLAALCLKNNKDFSGAEEASNFALAASPGPVCTDVVTKYVRITRVHAGEMYHNAYG